MISKPILELLYEAAHIQRWNDHMRPSQGFTELDKQAHKMIFAYVIARFEEDKRKAVINWPHLIEGGIFEFLHRIVLTDIKPPIFHAMMKESGEKLNRWAEVNRVKSHLLTMPQRNRCFTDLETKYAILRNISHH